MSDRQKGNWFPIFGNIRNQYEAIDPNHPTEFNTYAPWGGIEAFVESYGSRQMLYGSGMPVRDYGGMMLTLKHAEIDDADKQAIAGGNLERLLAWVGEGCA